MADLNTALLHIPTHFQLVSSTLCILPCLSEARGICRSSLAPQKWREPWYSCSTKHSKAFDEPVASGLTAIAVRRYDVVEGRRSILLGDLGWD